MQKKPSYFGFFLFFITLSVIVFSLSRVGVFRPLEPIFQVILVPIQSVFYGGFNFITGIGANPKINELKKQNLLLTKKLIAQDKLIEDNKALRDQFNSKIPRSINLTPARIVGAPGFIPGISAPETITLDKGSLDGIKVGAAIVVDDNIIGRVTKVTQYLSNVILVTNTTFSFTAKTLESNAFGVIKGQGGGSLILDNVVLSDNLKVGDTVITKGDLGVTGDGIPADLIIGKITAINKNPSDLFQIAQVKSLVDFVHLNIVYVVNF